MFSEKSERLYCLMSRSLNSTTEILLLDTAMGPAYSVALSTLSGPVTTHPSKVWSSVNFVDLDYDEKYSSTNLHGRKINKKSDMMTKTVTNYN